VAAALIQIGRLSGRGRNSTGYCTHGREWGTCHEQEACSSPRTGPPILRTGSVLWKTWPLAYALGTSTAPSTFSSSAGSEAFDFGESGALQQLTVDSTEMRRGVDAAPEAR